MPDALRNGPEASQSKGAPELKSERTPASLQKNLDEERQAAAHRRAGPVAASKPAQTAGPTRQREIQIQFQTQGVLDESNLRHTAENGGIGLDFGVGLKPSRPVLEITPSKPSELSIQSSLSLGQPAAAPRFEVSNLPQMLKRVATEYAQSGTDYACFSGKYWARQRNYTAYMPFLTSALGELDQAYPEIMADSDVRRLVCQIRSEMSLEKLAAESRMFAERLSQRLAYLEQLGLHPSANAGSEGLSVESTRSMGFYDLLK